MYNTIKIFLILLASISVQAQNKPNIVYILADDMGIGDISSLNKEAKLTTPNLDKLIDQGMNFTDAHTTSAVCTPSRYSIITGRYPWRTKLKKRVMDGYSNPMITDEVDTTPAMLKRNGYATAMVGKWHLGWDWVIANEEDIPTNKDNCYKFKKKDIGKDVDFTKPISNGPVDNGFEYFYGINASLDFPPYTYMLNKNVTVVPTLAFRSNTRDRNFPGGYKKDLAGAQRSQRPGLADPDFDANKTLQVLTENSVEYIKNISTDKPFFLYVALTSPHTPVLPSKEFVGKSESGAYGDFVMETDWSVGQIVKALKDKGVEGNTIVIFTTDNGASKVSFPVSFEEKYGHHPSRELKGRKGSLNEGGHRVPFIVQWKNTIKPNSVSDATISLGDLYATCAEIVGERVKNQGVDSYSILPELEGEKGKYTRPSSVYSDFAGRYAIRKGDYKLIFSPNKKKRQLFNLKEDIREKNNLYGMAEYEEIEKDLTADITSIISNGRSTEGKKLKNEGPKVWDALYWMK